MTRNIIVDCDTGVDDAVAIMLAALHPRLRLLGVTTVRGNAEVAVTTDNTLRVLDHVGRADVPVFAGLDRPLAPLDPLDPLDAAPPPRRHDTGSPYLPLPAATGTARERPAVDWLVETLRTGTEPVTLVATAPLTNVATAVTRAPRLLEAVAEVVVMGGGHASVERNVRNDPVAADVVLAAGFERLVLVPLDATYDAALTEEHCRTLADLGTPAGTAAAALVADRIRAYDGDPALRRRHGAGAAPVHDALAVAYLVVPEVLALRPGHVAVGTPKGPTYGRTVMSLDHGSGTPPNAHVAVHADARLFFDVLRDTFAVGRRSGGAGA